MKKLSVVICAFNEEKTIKKVILSVFKSQIVEKIIVVNDGSTDNTKQIIEELKSTIDLKAIHLAENKGKGYAMAVGVENAIHEVIQFVDADLQNIDIKHIEMLAKPVINNEADMVLGQATETLINYSINPFKSLTGERTLLKKDILPIIDKMKTSRFGVETLINLYYQSEGKRVKYIMLEGLKHPTKFDKTSSSKAVKEFIYEAHQIVLTAFKNFNLITKLIKNQLPKV